MDVVSLVKLSEQMDLEDVYFVWWGCEIEDIVSKKATGKLISWRIEEGRGAF